MPDINATFGPSNRSGGAVSSGSSAVAVPVFGDYRVSAELPPDYLIETDTKTGTITQNGVDVPVTLTFPETTTMTGRVLDTNGQPVPEGYITVEVGSSFAYSDYSDSTGAYSLLVPAGQPVLMSARDYNSITTPDPVGIDEFTAPTGVTTFTHDIVLDDVQMPQTLVDGNARSFTFQSGAEVLASGQASNRRRFSTLVRQSGSTSANDNSQYVARLSLGGRQLELPDRVGFGTIAGLFHTRKVYVPADGYFVRYLEVFENRGTLPVTFDAEVQGWNLTAWANQRVNATSSGDAIAAAGDQWVVAASSVGFSHTFAGAGGVLPTTTEVVVSSGMLSSTWTALTLQPGQRVSLLHFFGEHRDATAARGAAERLVQLPPEVLVGLTDQDRVDVINFVLPVTSAVTAVRHSQRARDA